MVFNQNGLCPNPLLILLIGLIMINFVNFIVNWQYGLSKKKKKKQKKKLIGTIIC